MLTVIVILVVLITGSFFAYKKHIKGKQEEAEAALVAEALQQAINKPKKVQETAPTVDEEALKKSQLEALEKIAKPAAAEPQSDIPVLDSSAVLPTAEPAKPAKKHYRRKYKPKK